MKILDRFYKNRVSLNVLAKGKENIEEIYKTAEGNVNWCIIKRL